MQLAAGLKEDMALINFTVSNSNISEIDDRLIDCKYASSKISSLLIDLNFIIDEDGWMNSINIRKASFKCWISRCQSLCTRHIDLSSIADMQYGALDCLIAAAEPVILKLIGKHRVFALIKYVALIQHLLLRHEFHVCQIEAHERCRKLNVGVENDQILRDIHIGIKWVISSDIDLYQTWLQ